MAGWGAQEKRWIFGYEFSVGFPESQEYGDTWLLRTVVRVNRGNESEDQGLDVKDQGHSSSGEGRMTREKSLGWCINRGTK